MPIYVYEVLDKEGGEPTGEVYEALQSMSDDALTHHPESGAPMRRPITAPSIGGSWSDSAMTKSANDNKKLEQLGFTKYEKRGDGYYEKTAGKQGPRELHRDGMD